MCIRDRYQLYAEDWDSYLSPEAFVFTKPISEAQWLWSGSQDNVPLKACFRSKLQIDAPVKQAVFHSFWDLHGNFFLNGQRLNLSLIHISEPTRPY